MIGWLRGPTLSVEDDLLTVEAGGVGYEVYVSPAAAADARRATAEVVELWIHTIVREDALLLYGFASPVERDLFRRMIAVSQVGPKIALSAMSVASVEDLVAAITCGRGAALLAQAKGIGPKVAERLARELAPSLSTSVLAPPAVTEAHAALVALGLDAGEATALLRDVDNDEDVQGMIKTALSRRSTIGARA